MTKSFARAGRQSTNGFTGRMAAVGPNTSGVALAGETGGVGHLRVPAGESVYCGRGVVHDRVKKIKKNIFFSRALVPSQLWYFIDSFVYFTTGTSRIYIHIHKNGIVYSLFDQFGVFSDQGPCLVWKFQ